MLFEVQRETENGEVENQKPGWAVLGSHCFDAIVCGYLGPLKDF